LPLAADRIAPAAASPEARARRALTSRIIRFDDPCQGERRRVETFIEDSYARAYGSHIGRHYPTLMSVQDVDGTIYAVVGFRLARDEPLFLEQYLDDPVETVVTDAIGTIVTRPEIVEIGNLASNGRGATIFLFAAMVRHLLSSGAHFAVATATEELRGMFQKAGLGALRLAAADPGRLIDHGLSWGDYYRTRPIVLAGSISAAATPLIRFAETTPTARAVRTRLHFRSEP
tara:strand:+ start:5704 stop:6396 length:693 start_codon:yes stop_codon:yes gene_type:complete